MLSNGISVDIHFDFSFLTMPDKNITQLIYQTHVPASPAAEKVFDEDSLFIIVENILVRATQIIDSIVQVYIYIHTHIQSNSKKLFFIKLKYF